MVSVCNVEWGAFFSLRPSYSSGLFHTLRIILYHVYIYDVVYRRRGLSSAGEERKELKNKNKNSVGTPRQSTGRRARRCRRTPLEFLILLPSYICYMRTNNMISYAAICIIYIYV